MAAQATLAAVRAASSLLTESASIRLFRKRTGRKGLDSNLESISLLAAFGRSLLYNTFVDPLRELGRTLLFLGGFLVLVMIGALLFFGGKLPLRLGKLPGDIVYHGEHSTFYFPVVTC